jgi:23S rRNA (cytidine2498-2'-O)-methyltransferase
LESSFLFTICQVGAEKALKSELGRLKPELKLAFSRPGFITFKSNEPLKPELELQSVFARAYGLSAGRWDEPSVDLLVAAGRDFAAKCGMKPRLHLWERDHHAPGEEPKGYVRGLQEKEILQRLGEPSPFAVDPVAQNGDWVFDVVLVEERQWWWGFHRHHRLHSRFPGGRPPVTLPEEAPSRAYLKLEEAIAHFEIPIRAGDTAVEVGSAPGGASFALVRRGVQVVGIDPAEMDPLFRRFRREQFIHLKRGVSAITRQDLPVSVQWLLLDMNVAPRTALKSILHLLPELHDSLLGCCFTIKLNEWSYADEIPGLLEDIRKLGFARVRATQLPSNAREFCVHALTRKGVAR